MPAKATLYNAKCEPIYDFGTGSRNTVHFNRHGNSIEFISTDIPNLDTQYTNMFLLSSSLPCWLWESQRSHGEHSRLFQSVLVLLDMVVMQEFWHRNELKLISRAQVSYRVDS